MKKVLIAGGTGLVGSRLTDIFMDHGYEVSHLSRQENTESWINTIHWDIETQSLDSKEIEGIDYIINLAGAGIADESWTEERIKIIKDSRILSNQLLRDTIAKLDQKPQLFLSASAIGYYGFITSEEIFTEESPAGKDLLSEICVEWEQSADLIKELGVEVAKVRIGIVLADDGGALPKMEEPIRWGVGAALGSGKQYMPWIHIDDLCNIFLHIIEHKLNGVYNAVAPQSVNNKEFTKSLAETLGSNILLPNVPSFLLRLIMGRRADLILKGSRVSSKKILDSGFEFTYGNLDRALADLYLID